MDVTPLVDVVFLLLIFFMVTTTFSLDRGIQLDLPKAETAESHDPSKKKWRLKVLVDDQGRYFIQGVEVLPKNLTEALRQAAQDKVDITVIVQADENSSHGSIVTLMDTARKINLTKFSLITLDKLQRR